MLKLIEEDADSFAQRAEMYYRKRPELIKMVEEFYRAHRLLAERYDQFKSESGTRLLTPWTMSPVIAAKYRPEKLMTLSSIENKSYDSYSESYELEEESELSEESDVEDPEPEEVQSQADKTNEVVSCGNNTNTELMMLREEIEKLKVENRSQKEQLMQKDEEKREVIRQLSIAMNMLKEENLQLRKRMVVDDSAKKQKTLEFNNKSFKGLFWKRLFK